MPELLEAEAYRRTAERALDREIVEVRAPDAWYLKRGLTAGIVRDALLGRRLVAARRIGKQVLVDTSDDGPVLGLHFGMSGKLLVDGEAAIDKLEYVRGQERPAWDRFALGFADGGDLVMRDPRRLGAVELDPDEGRWGIDATLVTPAQLRDLLAGSHAGHFRRLLGQDDACATGQGVADVGVAVAAGADAGDKGHARLHLARLLREAGQHHVGAVVSGGLGVAGAGDDGAPGGEEGRKGVAGDHQLRKARHGFVQVVIA